MQCWGCAGWWHAKCLELAPEYRGPWFCMACLAHFIKMGTRDVLLDEELVRYLALGKLPISRDAR